MLGPPRRTDRGGARTHPRTVLLIDERPGMHAPLTVSARTLLLILLAVVLATGALVSGRPAASAEADPVRIMPLGDSITGSPGCWRALLWNDLLAAGHTDIDFVGTLAPQGCGVTHDGDNEGHGGYLATTIAATDLLPGWLAATDPHVVVLPARTSPGACVLKPPVEP